MIRRLLHGEEGVAIIMALAFMVLAVPLVISALGLASTLSIDSRVKTGILKSQYSGVAGAEHALHRLLYEDGYAQDLETGVSDEYTITLNGEDVDISVLKLGEPVTSVGPPPADDSRRLQAQKVVTPTTADANTLTTFTYTITATNRDDDPSPLRKIKDLLPSGFSYVAGTTSGVTTNDPSISGQELTWNLAYLSITLQPGDSVTLIFDAQASVPEGNYCNEASWVEPGDDNSTTGMTALVKVGSPPDNLCQGAAATLTKTLAQKSAPGETLFILTYTITIENIGNVTLNMSRLRDLLPEGFSYVSGSTSGDITSDDPASMMWQGRNRLTWDFNPDVQFQPGETRTLAFDVEAIVEPGFYWNEVWATFDEFGYTYYTWPSAAVEAMAVYQITATDGESTVSLEVWLGFDSYIVKRWEISR